MAASVLSDRAAFVRAVCVNPADDLTRLAFADWLDEHGEHDRAEFVRVQCRIATLEREGYGWPVCAKCGRAKAWISPCCWPARTAPKSRARSPTACPSERRPALCSSPPPTPPPLTSPSIGR